MLYSLECSYCGLVSEHMMLMDEMDKKVDCPHCTGKLSRREHRLYDVPMIQGDTVAGNHSFGEYYDLGMGEYVTSKSHRKRLMDEKGLEEYSPDPEMKKHRDEAKYIRSNANINTPGALAAVRKEHKAAADKRRGRIMKESLDKSFRKTETQ